MIGIPKYAESQIKEKLARGDTETLIVSGTDRKDQFIKDTIKELNLRAKIFKEKPTKLEMKQAFKDYYFVYIRNLNEFGSDDKEALCDNLKTSTHTNFLGGIPGDLTGDNLNFYYPFFHCGRTLQHVHFFDEIPSEGLRYLIISIILILLLLGLFTISTCLLANRIWKKKLIGLGKDLKKESFEKYQSRGVDFEFNSKDQSNPSIEILFQKPKESQQSIVYYQQQNEYLQTNGYYQMK